MFALPVAYVLVTVIVVVRAAADLILWAASIAIAWFARMPDAPVFPCAVATRPRPRRHGAR